MKNVFDPSDSQDFINRINKLEPATQRLWGTMTVAQMLAHCNVTYELVYDSIHPKPGFFMKMLMKTLVKNFVVNEKPYPQNNGTGPQFKIKGDRDFEAEKKRLIDHIDQTQKLGATHFDGKESHSFGVLNVTEWNNMFAKHLDHHLRQFGV